MAALPDDKTEKHPAPARASDLPLAKDVSPEDRAVPPPQKNIHKTLGGHITRALIYGLIGFGANSAASVGITYFLMPKEWVKKPKEALAKSMSKIFKGTEHERFRTANSTLEILVMFASGTILTAGMVPLEKNRDKIAYWINQKLGRDTDVLPDHLKKVPEARTLEDKIQQEIDKRTNKHHSSGDVWSARWLALTAPFFGDMALSNWNNSREKLGKASADTVMWEAGGKFYDKVLAKKTWVDGVSGFFEKHGAGVEDIKTRAPEKYEMLAKLEKAHGGGSINPTRVMVAEQARMLTKEVGWTIIVAAIMEQLVGVFNRHRVHKEQQKAITEVTKQGYVPEGYKVTLEESVKLERTGTGNWAEKNSIAKARPEKAETYAKAVDSSRSGPGQQPAI